MSHHVIYVPGLGDSRTYGQNIAINLWRLFGLKPHYLALGWHQEEGFDVKLSRLMDAVDSLKKAGDCVSLVGISAGASAVLNAYAQRRDLTAVVCICGKIQNPETIGHKVYEKNPDFKDSMELVRKSLNRLSESEINRILSIHPLRDKTVPIDDTKIPGALEKTIPAQGHISGIFVAVLIGAPIISRFLHSWQRQE